MLDRDGWVERYAWFALQTDGWLGERNQAGRQGARQGSLSCALRYVLACASPASSGNPCWHVRG